ncbi:MAG: c-type cytochrome, partial [Planctomycetes bacterium]|nr:c-type cytochrome [Planctomycetota bacterium]
MKLLAIIMLVLTIASVLLFVLSPISPRSFSAEKFYVQERNYVDEAINNTKYWLGIVREDSALSIEFITRIENLLEKIPCSVEMAVQNNHFIDQLLSEFPESNKSEINALKDSLCDLRAHWTPDPLKVKKGRMSYWRYCIGCHGPAGDGFWMDDVQEKIFGCSPADLAGFTNIQKKPLFKFTSTGYNELPTSKDLVKTIKRGIPGTSMPSFKKIADPEIEDII